MIETNLPAIVRSKHIWCSEEQDRRITFSKSHGGVGGMESRKGVKYLFSLWEESAGLATSTLPIIPIPLTTPSSTPAIYLNGFDVTSCIKLRSKAQ